MLTLRSMLSSHYTLLKLAQIGAIRCFNALVLIQIHAGLRLANGSLTIAAVVIGNVDTDLRELVVGGTLSRYLVNRSERVLFQLVLHDGLALANLDLGVVVSQWVAATVITRLLILRACIKTQQEHEGRAFLPL